MTLITKYLQDWCKNAGIDKKITFHSARHTFAVLQLSLVIPIFIVQKFLGYSSIVSTQAYANIVDSEKEWVKIVQEYLEQYNNSNGRLQENKKTKFYFAHIEPLWIRY